MTTKLLKLSEPISSSGIRLVIVSDRLILISIRLWRWFRCHHLFNMLLRMKSMIPKKRKKYPNQKSTTTKNNPNTAATPSVSVLRKRKKWLKNQRKRNKKKSLGIKKMKKLKVRLWNKSNRRSQRKWLSHRKKSRKSLPNLLLKILLRHVKLRRIRGWRKWQMKMRR